MGGIPLLLTTAFDAKALPITQRGRSPGFHPAAWRLLRSKPTQWLFLPAEKMMIYSCATAHDLHVIPSSSPFLRGNLDEIKQFKVLLQCPLPICTIAALRLQLYTLFLNRNDFLHLHKTGKSAGLYDAFILSCQTQREDKQIHAQNNHYRMYEQLHGAELHKEFACVEEVEEHHHSC